MTKSMYLCVHILQVVPVSCINRDDTGTPKTCIYGGTPRMRVSSQCWKRAARMYLRDKYADDGVRTKDIVCILSRRLIEECKCTEGEALDFVVNWLKKVGVISDKYKVSGSKIGKNGKDNKERSAEEKIEENSKDTSAFFSTRQIEKISELMNKRFLEEKEGKTDNEAKKNNGETQLIKELKEAVKGNPSLSELLFGRFFASNQDLNYDAACQVAHAFSVNEVVEEPDYFTVVSDLRSNANSTGSDYLDTKLFNSGVLYRFANVNLSEGSELRNNLYDVDAAKAASRFLESFIVSMPKGSINGYANMTIPEQVIVELREDMPVSFAPAFAKAVDSKDICADAIKTMATYEDRVSKFCEAPLRKWVWPEMSLKELYAQVEAEIRGRL